MLRILAGLHRRLHLTEGQAVMLQNRGLMFECSKCIALARRGEQVFHVDSDSDASWEKAQFALDLPYAGELLFDKMTAAELEAAAAHPATAHLANRGEQVRAREAFDRQLAQN